MNNAFIPSQFYRNAVRQIITQYSTPADADPDIDFRKYLESNYIEVKKRFTHFEEYGLSKSDLKVVRVELFVLATGLLTFGRLDVAEDILDCIPSSGSVRRLTLALKAMLPLPEDLDPMKESDLVREWVRANAQNLKWNEQMGRFIKETYKNID